MDILNHIFTSGITPTNKIYFNLQAKLPLTIRHSLFDFVNWALTTLVEFC